MNIWRIFRLFNASHELRVTVNVALQHNFCCIFSSIFYFTQSLSLCVCVNCAAPNIFRKLHRSCTDNKTTTMCTCIANNKVYCRFWLAIVPAMGIASLLASQLHAGFRMLLYCFGSLSVDFNGSR